MRAVLSLRRESGTYCLRHSACRAVVCRLRNAAEDKTMTFLPDPTRVVGVRRESRGLPAPRRRRLVTRSNSSPRSPIRCGVAIFRFECGLGRCTQVTEPRSWRNAPAGRFPRPAPKAESSVHSALPVPRFFSFSSTGCGRMPLPARPCRSSILGPLRSFTASLKQAPRTSSGADRSQTVPFPAVAYVAAWRALSRPVGWAAASGAAVPNRFNPPARTRLQMTPCAGVLRDSRAIVLRLRLKCRGAATRRRMRGSEP